MAKSTIDIFPFLKQWKADIAPVFPLRKELCRSAKHLYGSLQISAQAYYYFQGGIKEDI